MPAFLLSGLGPRVFQDGGYVPYQAIWADVARHCGQDGLVYVVWGVRIGSVQETPQPQARARGVIEHVLHALHALDARRVQERVYSRQRIVGWSWRMRCIGSGRYTLGGPGPGRPIRGGTDLGGRLPGRA